LEEEDCLVRYISQPLELGNPNLIIVPGTKSTVNDLEYLRHTGLDKSLLLKAKEGVPILGICGGYQILGKKILDPNGVESAQAEVDGLELLNIVTTFVPEKSTRQVRARVASDIGLLSGIKGLELSGYEIHMGETASPETSHAFQVFEIPQGATDYRDGSLNADGTILGTYLHGLFHNEEFRNSFLNFLRRRFGLPIKNKENGGEKINPYDRLAELVRISLDMDKVYMILEQKT
jgi:adenosylcobyric acid synthase